MFSAGPREAASSQAGSSSSLLGACSQPILPRTIASGQSQPGCRVPFGMTEQPVPSLLTHRPQWKEHPAPHQALWPPPSRTTTGIPNIRQSISDSAMGSRLGRGRGGFSQFVGARSAAPTLGPRSVEKTRKMREQLLDVFPNYAEQVDAILQQNPQNYSVDELCLKVAKMV